MNKIVVQVRGYDPYDHNIFDQSTRNVKDENLANHIAEIIQNVKGCINSPDYSFYRMFVIDLETASMELVYEHTNPVWERIEVNLAAKKKINFVPKRSWSPAAISSPSYSEEEEDDLFEEQLVATMPIAQSFNQIFNSITAVSTPLAS